MANNFHETRPEGRNSALAFKPLAVAFAVSLAAAPVNASITLPDDPLTTGTRVAPNILFILDDSGSMGANTMWNETLSAPSNIGEQTYTYNTIYYNPSITYRPWLRADGSRLTGGMAYGAAFMHHDNPTLPIDLSDSNSCNRSNDNGNNRWVCGGVQTFYVPIDLTNVTSDYLSNRDNYYRYQILENGRIVRSRRLARSGSSPAYNNGAARNVGGCNNTSQNTTTWRECEFFTPTGRTEAEERANFATWFSYHRTRMKVAKAGASEAFGTLDGAVRVGFRTLFTRDRNNRTALNIPVENGNDGRFVDMPGSGPKARTDWYDRLHSIENYSTTPLRTALNEVGGYFSRTDAAGPYGPEAAGNQLACRQNFSILTTDGAWNDNSPGVGNQDDAAGALIQGPGGRQYQYQPSAPFRDGASATLADVAMRYWKTDLRTDLLNIVPTTGANPAFWQHMVTFGISIGLSGNSGWRSVAEVPVNAQWSNGNSTGDKIDDLLHAAVNSRGDFVSASNPEQFTAGLTAALAAITERTGSFSNVGANSTSVDGGTRIYQASYVSGVWTGELSAYPIVGNVVSPTRSWRASEGIPASGRRIFATHPDGGNAVAFPDGMPDDYVDNMARTGVTNYPVTGEDNLAYLAGARDNEQLNGGVLRNRNHLLGDIVTSSPAYVADTDTIYVGANDGMLHAFDAADGGELFGYIPGGIDHDDLSNLSRQDYAHRYFVDGPVVVTTRKQTPDRNVLVAALGKGGKGVFALDVTSPSSFATSDFMWEVNDRDGLIGLVQSKPIFAKLNNGDDGVIFANGINSSRGVAALVVLNLDTGDVVSLLSTEVGSNVKDSEDANGLNSAIGWDADGNGTVDAVYGGDMLGNVWKFDLSSSSASSWGVANDEAPIFSAINAAGDRQPITAGLTVALHPRTYQPWLFFGTGRLLTSGDMTSIDVQSLYGFVDDGSSKSRTGAGANLTQRSIVEANTLEGLPVRAFERRQALPAGSKGWYIDLLQPPVPGTAEGERAVSDAQLYGDVLIISTVIPTADACQSDGRGYINAIDAYTGTSTGPSLFDLNGNGSFDEETIGDDDLPVGSVDLGVGMPTLAEVLRGLAVVGGSSGNVGGVPIREARNVGRVSWREVLLD